jgi:site-specific DNA-methyltransferase (adenine-specific)
MGAATVGQILPELEHLAEPIDTLRLYERNPRRGVVAKIAESLSANGQYRAVTARRSSREVLAGNHTLQAARSLGWSHVAVEWIDVDDEQAARIVLVDNRLSDLATYDDEALLELLQYVPDLTGTGYDDAALAALLAATDEPVALTDVDEPAPVPATPRSRVGEVWQLGDSLLLVGDATDTAAVVGMLDGRVPDCVWTDPPYGVNYVGGTSDALTILNDGSDDLPGLLLGAFTTAVHVARPGAPVYVAHASTEGHAFETALAAAGVLVRQQLVWVKSALVMGRADYHYRHEPIYAGTTPPPADDDPEPGGAEQAEPTTHELCAYGFTPGGRGRLGRGGEHWFGDNSASTVFEFPKPRRNGEHPTMKPVDLIRAMLANSCPPGGLVLDLFGGSGSTLIAAHHQHAAAALVELDPRYADAICRRWQEHTGGLPILRSTGAAVDFTAEEVTQPGTPTGG